jgi:hypothetical protein
VIPPTPELARLLAEVCLVESGAQEDLDQLVALGCDRKRLLFDLGNLLREPHELDSWEGLVGFKPKQTQTVLKRIRTCADEIEHIQTSLMGEALIRSSAKFRELSTLPAMLQQFALAWDAVTKSVRPRNRLALNTIMERLVQHVIERTGKPHDREVSALIDALRPAKKPYDETAHRVWRSRHMRQRKTP